ncbi:glycosyltransferase [Caulobacter sp. RHG1]|uniref:glycosyltransferase n=1 Tax=Caulobacter sp. (strain RHG1) TaxID=2545762 RepID=UPI001555FCBB|nr:glycosyltransferase [Caulobacter sp. RHG1]NQE64932.1 N-acetylglucosaminyltransferase [Caulobacter sp. RHG1]
MTRKEGLEPALAPASGGFAPVERAPAERVSTALEVGGRDGAHQSLSPAQAVAVALAGLLAATGVALDPDSALAAAHHLFFAVFLLGGLTRLAAACTPLPSARAPPLADQDLPTYTIITPLYREAEVLAELVQSLEAIDYPRERLQVLIVLEADDETTQAAARSLDLPSFVSVLVAPPGVPKTKPRACNYALDHAKGEVVVIYDAEDMPDPGQLREAAARFAASDPRLACLQAPLRIEDPGLSLFLPSQFRLEYAAHFEVLLPALARWGLAFPLGGTSNHFKAAPLREVGAWDAFNVTEDADVGFRLAAAGYRLGVIARPTWETAPTTWGQWLPQRARWIKGHMQTLFVHARGPVPRQPRNAVALVLTLAQSVTSSHLHGPVMAAALVLAAMDWLPDGDIAIPRWDLMLYVLGWGSAAIAGARGVMRAGHRPKSLHLLGMAFYWLLQSLAAAKALQQFVTDPHRWDKTAHAPRVGPRSGPPEA